MLTLKSLFSLHPSSFISFVVVVVAVANLLDSSSDEKQIAAVDKKVKDGKIDV